MKEEIKNIKFQNQKRPQFSFDLIKVEELYARKIDHDITQPHKIDFFNLLILTEGEGKHTIDFIDYDLKKGILVTVRKDQIHSFFRSTSAKGYMLIFTEDFLASHFSRTQVLKSFQLFNELLSSPKIELNDIEFKEITQLISNIEAEYNDHDDEFSMGIIRSALHMLVIKLFRIKSVKNEKFKNSKYLDEFLQFQKLVEEKCFETKKAIDYAKLMNCTTKTLNNICKAILNKSSKAIIDDIVITQIKRLLINSTDSITEVAYTSGFDEPTNMYKYFKKHTDFSPEAFRKSYA